MPRLYPPPPADLVVEPAVYDLIDRHPLTPPGTPFPPVSDTSRQGALATGESGSGTVLRQGPLPGLSARPSLAEDIRNAATVSVDVPDRRHIDNGPSPKARR